MPHTVKVATAANRALTRPADHTLAATEPLAVIATPRGRNPSRAPLAGSGNPSLVGTAVDVLLNQTLDPSYRGHGLRGSPTVGGADLVSNCERALTPLLAAIDVRAAAPHVLLLAAFHQAHRSIDVGLALRQALEQHEPEVVEDCRGVLWQAADEDDLVALGTAALEDLAFARDAEQLVVNPVFGLSRRLGGADGDLINDGTLWDYKTTATSRSWAVPRSGSSSPTS